MWPGAAKACRDGCGMLVPHQQRRDVTGTHEIKILLQVYNVEQAALAQHQPDGSLLVAAVQDGLLQGALRKLFHACRIVGDSADEANGSVALEALHVAGEQIQAQRHRRRVRPQRQGDEISHGDDGASQRITDVHRPQEVAFFALEDEVAMWRRIFRDFNARSMRDCEGA